MVLTPLTPVSLVYDHHPFPGTIKERCSSIVLKLILQVKAIKALHAKRKPVLRKTKKHPGSNLSPDVFIHAEHGYCPLNREKSPCHHPLMNAAMMKPAPMVASAPVKMESSALFRLVFPRTATRFP